MNELKMVDITEFKTKLDWLVAEAEKMAKTITPPLSYRWEEIARDLRTARARCKGFSNDNMKKYGITE